MKNIWKKIKNIFSSHYAMERFGISFLSLSFCMAILLVSMGIKAYKDSQKTLSEQVMYTTSVETSLTGQQGTVEGIYHNTDRTKCFVLLKFDDVSQLSINAENYQMFATGFSASQEQEPLVKRPYGCIYVFGSTGYMGIYMTSSGGFEKQIMGVTVRCNKTIVDTTISDASATYMDASFDSYDQFRIYFNPVGTATQLSTSLDKERFDTFELYEELVTKPNEIEIRNNLTEDLKEMHITQKARKEYEERVAREGIGTYNIPKQIDGDVVEGDEDGVYHFTTDYVLPNGVDFDWYNGSIHDGYLDELKGELSYTEYLDNLEEQEDTSDDPENAFKTDTIWYMTDGSTFEGDEYSDADLDDASYKEIKTATDLLKNSWGEFYTLKQQYQCKDLVSLLKLEKEAREAQSHYTINTSENVLQVY